MVGDVCEGCGGGEEFGDGLIGSEAGTEVPLHCVGLSGVEEVQGLCTCDGPVGVEGYLISQHKRALDVFDTDWVASYDERGVGEEVGNHHLVQNDLRAIRKEKHQNAFRGI